MRYTAEEFEQLVLLWQKPVFQLITQITGDPHATDKIAQEVFVRFWFSRNKWRTASDRTIALIRLAVRLSIAHLRDTGRPCPGTPETWAAQVVRSSGHLTEAEIRRIVPYRGSAPLFRAAVVVLAILIAAGAAFAQRGQRGRSSTSPSGEQSPPIGKSDAEKRILATIEQAVSAGALYANVPAADGRMLRLLTETSNAKNVVEIGTSTGISGMWFAMALGKTGGKLTTFEYDAGRAATARKHFAQAGVDRIVTIVEGDAHVNITKLKEAIDIVFIDADKEGYVDYLNKLLPLVRPGGLLLAHNVNMVPEYIKAVMSSADLDTTVYTTGGGLAITLKKR